MRDDVPVTNPTPPKAGDGEAVPFNHHELVELCMARLVRLAEQATHHATPAEHARWTRELAAVVAMVFTVSVSAQLDALAGDESEVVE